MLNKLLTRVKKSDIIELIKIKFQEVFIMTAKNALLFCLAVFGIIFIGVDAVLPLIGITAFSGVLTTLGSAMLVLFLMLVLGFGFMVKVIYLVGTAVLTTMATNTLCNSGDLVMGIIYAVVAFILLALIPAVFLKKK